MNWLTVIRAALVLVVSAFLAPVIATTTLHPLFAVAIAFALVVFVLDILLPLAQVTKPVAIDLNYLVLLAVTAIFVGALAVSPWVKAIIGEPTATQLFAVLLAPGVLNYVANKAGLLELVKPTSPAKAAATV